MKKYVIVISFLFIIFIGYNLGKLALPIKTYKMPNQSFIAKVKEVNVDSIKVKGIDSNEKDFRNKWFIISLKGTKLRWQNEKIKMINLNKGDNVLITFTGEATSTYPTTINNVSLLELKEEYKNAKLIKVNDILYYDTKKIDTNNKSNKYDGKITKQVDRNSIPTENNESNFGINLNYQKNDLGLEVSINNEWHIFEKK